jgi:hypothetical protein
MSLSPKASPHATTGEGTGHPAAVRRTSACVCVCVRVYVLLCVAPVKLERSF